MEVKVDIKVVVEVDINVVVLIEATDGSDTLLIQKPLTLQKPEKHSIDLTHEVPFDFIEAHWYPSKYLYFQKQISQTNVSLVFKLIEFHNYIHTYFDFFWISSIILNNLTK